MLQRTCAMLCLIACLSGCGTLALGTSQLVRIQSEPAGAQVAINGRVIGETPATVRLSTTAPHILQVSMCGYEPQIIQISKVFNNWTWLNLLMLPFILPTLVGFAVDANTGGMYRLSPDEVNVAFTQFGDKPNGAAGDLAVFVVLEPDPSWEKIGQLTPLPTR